MNTRTATKTATKKRDPIRFRAGHLFCCGCDASIPIEVRGTGAEAFQDICKKADDFAVFHRQCQPKELR